MIIESTDNEKIKYYRKIRSSKYIKECGEFIVEGEHLVEEAITSGVAKEVILLGGKDYKTELPKIYVNERVLKTISLLEAPQYIMAVCKVKYISEEYGNRILILDNVSDPGNLGTIIRTSVAFGVSSIVLSENSVNVYNDKVIRASQGMIFKINIFEKELTSFIKEIKSKNIKVYGTDLSESKTLSELSKPDSYALVLGNEGAGVRKEILGLCDEKVIIEMNNECESLNVGISAGIILYEWRNI